MITVLSIVAGALVLASLPFWLPQAILAVRNYLFRRINGPEGIAVPGDVVGSDNFRRLYGHAAADGRSRGAALSDLFWYWLSPGPEVHQEHIEPGARYDEVAATTRRFLAVPKWRAEEAAARCAIRALERLAVRHVRLVRLRDIMMPIWAEFYYELVFAEPCPASARDLIVANANDVVTALKCCSLRHMERRARLTRFLLARVEAGRTAHPLPALLSAQEQALYLQGVFFNTAIVQMSEAMAHLCMALAQHGEVCKKLVAELDDDRYFDDVIAETFRQYPLFGIAHRITSDDIGLGDGTVIAKGSVLCFNYLDYHRSGFGDPDRFDPGRWQRVAGRVASYIPFGVTGNRPCPAQALALVTMRAAAREILRRVLCYSSASHIRSIPNRGPCLLVSRERGCSPLLRRVLLVFIAVRDRWEDVSRSVVQLVFGTYMVWHARRQRLCQRYFETVACPVVGHASRGGAPR